MRQISLAVLSALILTLCITCASAGQRSISAQPRIVDFKINGGDATTTSTTVVLQNIITGSRPSHYMASEQPGFNGARWKPYVNFPHIKLMSYNGTKYVYFKVKDPLGRISNVVVDSIELAIDQPDKPSNLYATSTTNGIKLTWSSSLYTAYYGILRNGAYLAATTTSTYTDTTASTGMYCYQVYSYNADWTKYAGPTNEACINIAPTISPSWTYTTMGAIYTLPAIGADGTIYIGGADNNLHALYPNGTVKWLYSAQSEVIRTPALGPDGTIYFGTLNNYLHAVSPWGVAYWTLLLPNWVNGSPAIGADGTIYVSVEGGLLYALYPNGQVKWVVSTKVGLQGGYPSAPVIGADGTIYVVDYTLSAYSPSGILLWTYPIAYGYLPPAIGSDGTIYVAGTGQQALYAFYPNGQLRWSVQYFDRFGSFFTSPVVGRDGTIYISGYREDTGGRLYLYAIDPASGYPKWTKIYYDYASVPDTLALSSDGLIYVYWAKDGLSAIDAATGTTMWTSGGLGGPLVTLDSSGIVYSVNSYGNKLYAFQGTGGLDVYAPWPKYQGDQQNSGRY